MSEIELLVTVFLGKNWIFSIAVSFFGEDFDNGSELLVYV